MLNKGLLLEWFQTPTCPGLSGWAAILSVQTFMMKSGEFNLAGSALGASPSVLEQVVAVVPVKYR